MSGFVKGNMSISGFKKEYQIQIIVSVWSRLLQFQISVSKFVSISLSVGSLTVEGKTKNMFCRAALDPFKLFDKFS